MSSNTTNGSSKTKHEVLDQALALASAISRLAEAPAGAPATKTKPRTTTPKRSQSGSRIQAVLQRLTRLDLSEILSRICLATGRSRSNARSLISYDSPTLETLVILADALHLQIGRLATALSAELSADPLPGWTQQKRWGVVRADLR